MPADDYLNFLRGTELLSGMPDEVLALVSRQLRPLRVAAGEAVFDEGSAGDVAYLIVEGELALLSGGVEVVRWGPGALVGEFSLIDDQPRSASGIACTPLTLLGWERQSFLQALAGDPEMARGILRVLTRKLRNDSLRGIDLLLERERWQHDLDRSREIQRGLLPPEVLHVHGLEVAGHCAPAGAVGGDFYDVLGFADGRTAVLIADVTGHGFFSGLFAAMAKSCLHTQARFSAAPAGMLDALRRTLALSPERRILMSCVYAVFDREAATLAFANAGHPHPLHWRAADGQVAALPVLDPILGAQEVGESQYCFRSAAWQPGDLLVLYSDGVTEARDAHGEEFGRARLERAVAAAAGAGAVRVRDRVLAAVRTHTGTAALRDDATLVVVRGAGGAP